MSDYEDDSEQLEIDDEIVEDDTAMDTTAEEVELEEKVEVKPDWVEDHTVPPGYKRRIFENDVVVKFKTLGVMTPDGLQFKSRQSALRVLIKRKASAVEIEEMYSCLVHEGWETHELLPQGWRIRKNNKRRLNKEDQKKIDLLNEKADIFKSLKDALNYVEKNLDEESLVKLMSLIELVNVETRLEIYDWTDDDSVPSGWKMRIAEGKVNKEYFLSPDGKMFPSRTTAVQHMIRENFSPDEIDQMRLKLVEHENWQYHGKLPYAWLIKEDGKKDVKFLTREGDILQSFLKVFEYIKTQDGYSNIDQELIQQLMSEISIGKRLDGYDWTKDDTVPSGWKSRKADSKTEKQYFLSPEGLQFSSRFVAFQHMIKHSYPFEMVFEMRQFLR